MECLLGLAYSKKMAVVTKGWTGGKKSRKKRGGSNQVIWKNLKA